MNGDDQLDSRPRPVPRNRGEAEAAGGEQGNLNPGHGANNASFLPEHFQVLLQMFDTYRTQTALTSANNLQNGRSGDQPDMPGAGLQQSRDFPSERHNTAADKENNHRSTSRRTSLSWRDMPIKRRRSSDDDRRAEPLRQRAVSPFVASDSSCDEDDKSRVKDRKGMRSKPPTNKKVAVRSPAQCAICLEKGRKDLYCTSCGHTYHKGCMDLWVKKAKKAGNPSDVCSVCKKTFTDFFKTKF